MADRPARIAVVGAGPAGFYATRALLGSGVEVSVDLIERLPTPHGLVRFGVAPDHWVVKSKSYAFDRILADPRVRLLGNIGFGDQLTRADLLRCYDAIIYTVGAAGDRRLGIPGETLSGSLSAREFVGWYNGHPEQAGLEPDLSHPAVAVIGMGNVALDVARILCMDPDDLARTDMAPHAVEALRSSRATDVHIVGRRGPSQAGFTPKEVREVAELDGVEMLVDPTDLAEDRPSPSPRSRRNVELFTLYSQEAAQRAAMADKRVHIHFLLSPVELTGSGGRVASIRLERNRIVGEELRVEPTGEQRTLDVGLVLRSVGYRSVPLPGLPFDEARGIVANDGGRVAEREYVSGWARRGPSGVIGTNKFDAEEVVATLVASLADERPAADPAPESIDRLLEQRDARVIDKDDWQRLSKEERRLGSRHRAERHKFTRVDDMLRFLDSSAERHMDRSCVHQVTDSVT